MKVHYINMLFFALPLNILVYNQRNRRRTTPLLTQKIPTTRLLCECELYTPTNYDNDPQMKEVMENFNKQTQERFHEYDERMQSKRMQCKDRCDKEIQKIILKDKLEKQMEEQLTTLETKITTDDIPTCVCEKSMADKTEKFCLNCGMNVGGGVTLSSGVLGGIGEALISAWKPLALAAAKEAAEKAATKAATEAGVREVISIIKGFSKAFSKKEGLVDLRPIVNESTYNNFDALFQGAKTLLGDSCKPNPLTRSTNSFCNSTICEGGERTLRSWVQAGSDTFQTTLTTKTTEFETAKVGAVNTGFESSISSINAAIIAIVVIVLIMVIIYLILRYRRKKKMKKKLQYIKLLEQ
ncbi:rifin [Plasmodium reichenowi]|uniref:Rifin n=1 Tax=Plasmodium reichenowi TaxID=5854 RepID=A0A060RQF7_PLARE|nr:rifin [Plasmodium reichenowi]